MARERASPARTDIGALVCSLVGPQHRSARPAGPVRRCGSRCGPKQRPLSEVFYTLPFGPWMAGAEAVMEGT